MSVSFALITTGARFNGSLHHHHDYRLNHSRSGIMNIKRIGRVQKEILKRSVSSPILVSLSETGKHYSLTDGTTIPQESVKGLFDRKLLNPVGDGLFGFSQTYTAKKEVLTELGIAS